MLRTEENKLHEKDNQNRENMYCQVKIVKQSLYIYIQGGKQLLTCSDILKTEGGSTGL